MIDYFVQNFNLPTFFLALAVFVLVSNIFNIIVSYIRSVWAKQAAKKAEIKLGILQDKLKAADQQLDKHLKGDKK